MDDLFKIEQKPCEYTMTCPGFQPEADCPYPLCDNPACAYQKTCCQSAHMNETPYKEDDQ